jgi:subtilisin family serine protease
MKLRRERLLIYGVLIILGFSAVQLIFSFYQKDSETSQPLEIVEKNSRETTFVASSEVSPETNISSKTVAAKTDFARKIISAKSPDQANQILETITARGGEIISEKEGLIVARLPKEGDKEIENDLNASGLIENLEVDYPTFVVGEAIDWGVERIGAPDVWETTQAAGISVGIVDTGIDYTHPELENRYLGGYDFVNRDEDPMDDHGHGTHVSGIAASSLNDVGTAGVSPETGIYGLKVLGSDGSGYVSDVVEAVDWAIDNNLQVLNFSLGSTYDSEILEEKIQEAVSKGIISVAAAGNTNGGSLLYPAAYSSVIAVSATDGSDNFAGFSSVGAELAAPGVSINSTVPGGGYATWSGTSMSSPHVAATAALMISNQEENIREGLRNTALDLGPTGKDSYYGYGLVQSKPAVLGEDVLDPAVSFLSPENESEVSGEVEVKLDIQDESAIEKVVLYINGEKVKEWPEGEPTVPNLEHLFDSLFSVYERLKELGFTYYQGKITVIDMETDSNE